MRDAAGPLLGAAAALALLVVAGLWAGAGAQASAGAEVGIGAQAGAGALVTIGARTGAAPADAGGRGEVADPLAVSARTAAHLGLRVGDVVEISAEPSFARARRARVVAVWHGPEHPADVARQEALVRLPLHALEAVLGRDDTVDRIVVRLQGGADPARVRDDLRATVAGVDVYTAAELVERTSRTFAVVVRFHRAISVVTILASGIFLVAVMTLKLAEMRRELGALRLAGVGRATVWRTVVGLAAVMALAGTAAGVVMGAVLVAGINGYYRPRFETALVFARLEGRTVRDAAALAVALGLGAGVAVAGRLARRSPLELIGR
ncbi:MAG: FtsX-like permease family protein [Armatimonadota bacterium]|nr:FtsX-like permease family protein [Armatimonadota bacterium]MDR7484796.1 FtsX-like permease family protein [Armatimonadota bacterium]MDR7531911.1 FtsX-like permease family protein [Armatimonadota bacterium]MDR7534744.1 FtsX-like permease family protein [Armatimonadota bacterium]